MTEIDHYAALFDHNYMRWFALQGEPALVEITKVRGHVELTLPGGRKTRKPVIDLKLIKGKITDIKPLVLNATNAAMIASIHGEKPSKWKGKQIVLYQSETEMFDKDLKKMRKTECIRVRAAKQQATVLPVKEIKRNLDE